MEIKRIVAFGASITKGTGLNDVSQAYPYLIKSRTEVIINAEGGRSNLEILYEVLRFKFKQGDLVLIGWGPVQRDVVFGKDGSLARYYAVGRPNNDELFLKWAYVHDEPDMGVRAWFYAHHADSYMKTLNLPVRHACFDGRLYKYKPNYIDVPVLDLEGVAGLDIGNDNVHPGVESHKAFADLIKMSL